MCKAARQEKKGKITQQGKEKTARQEKGTAVQNKEFSGWLAQVCAA